jgi:hypothetical protein
MPRQSDSISYAPMYSCCWRADTMKDKIHEYETSDAGRVHDPGRCNLGIGICTHDDFRREALVPCDQCLRRDLIPIRGRRCNVLASRRGQRAPLFRRTEVERLNGAQLNFNAASQTPRCGWKYQLNQLVQGRLNHLYCGLFTWVLVINRRLAISSDQADDTDCLLPGIWTRAC